MFDSLFWCCWCMNCWSFNCSLRIEVFCFGFSVDAHMFNPLVKGWEEVSNRILIFNYFYENLFVVPCRIVVSPERHSVSDVRGTSSNTILFDYLCCFSFNSFNVSYFVIMLGDAEDVISVLRLSISISIFFHYSFFFSKMIQFLLLFFKYLIGFIRYFKRYSKHLLECDVNRWSFRGENNQFVSKIIRFYVVFS